MKGVAVITGASSGLGEALARELHGRGWKVGLIARREEQLRELVSSLGENADFAAADVSDVEATEGAVRQLEQSLEEVINHATGPNPNPNPKWEVINHATGMTTRGATPGLLKVTPHSASRTHRSALQGRDPY